MQYGIQQIIGKRRLAFNFSYPLFYLWLSFLVPIIIPTLFFFWIPFCIALFYLEIIQDPLRNKDGNFYSIYRSLFTISWPKSIELYKKYECNFIWHHNDDRISLQLFLPSSFSPHSIHLTSKSSSFSFRGRTKGLFSDIDLYLQIRSKFNLIYFYYPIYHKVSIKVIPPIITLAKQIQIIGSGYENHLSKLLGGESEFHGMKPYQIGDSFRSINWKKSSINLSELYANIYEKEQNRDTLILINTGMSSMFPYKNYSYIDYQLSLAYELSKTYLKNNDKVGILTFSNQIDSYLAPDLSHIQLSKIFDILSNVEENYESIEFSHLYLFLQNKLKPNTILIMLSPFLSYKQLYVQKDTIHEMSLKYQVVWVNPQRTSNNLKINNLPVTLWAKAWNLLDNLEQKRFFESYKFKLVFEMPEKIYQETLKHYYSLKW